jgi:hypothetical protein
MKYRTLIAFEPEQISILRRLSLRREESVSNLVRKAVNLFVEKEKINPASLLLESLEKNKNKLKSAFKITDRNLSKNVDKILYEQS